MTHKMFRVWMVLDQTVEVECLVSVTLILNFPLERSRAYNMEKDVLMFTKVAEFAPHRVYYHGCLKDFVEITQWNGAEVHFHQYYIHDLSLHSMLTVTVNCQSGVGDLQNPMFSALIRKSSYFISRAD